MRGRKPKTTEDHKQSGTLRPHRHANRLVASVLSGIPEAPDDFDQEHAAKWYEVCGYLKDFEILAKQDGDAIRSYVESHLTATRSYLEMQRIGFYMDTDHGHRLHPLWRVYQDARKMEKALYDQFAFTPRARMAIKVDKDDKPPADPAAFLFEN